VCGAKFPVSQKLIGQKGSYLFYATCDPATTTATSSVQIRHLLPLGNMHARFLPNVPRGMLPHYYNQGKHHRLTATAFAMASPSRHTMQCGIVARVIRGAIA